MPQTTKIRKTKKTTIKTNRNITIAKTKL
jgi:hypothetical protein